MERNRISSLQSHGKALEKDCCLPGVFRDIIIIIIIIIALSGGRIVACRAAVDGTVVR